MCGKKISKHVAAFDYMDTILTVFSGTSGGVCIISSASVVGARTGIARASFTVSFFFNNRNNQEITEYNKKQKEKAW